MKTQWPEIIDFLSESTSTHCVCCSRHVLCSGLFLHILYDRIHMIAYEQLWAH